MNHILGHSWLAAVTAEPIDGAITS
jgi:hypothetical protein